MTGETSEVAGVRVRVSPEAVVMGGWPVFKALVGQALDALERGQRDLAELEVRSYRTENGLAIDFLAPRKEPAA